MWAPLGDPVILATGMILDVFMWVATLNIFSGVLNCIRALSGQSYGTTAETAFDTDSFVEKEYFSNIRDKTGDIELAMNW